jgi:hypothetical protein
MSDTELPLIDAAWVTAERHRLNQHPLGDEPTMMASPELCRLVLNSLQASWAERDRLAHLHAPKPDMYACQRCGRRDGLDCVIPNHLWNQIERETGYSVLCVWCLDADCALRRWKVRAMLAFNGRAITAGTEPLEVNDQHWETHIGDLNHRLFTAERCAEAESEARVLADTEAEQLREELAVARAALDAERHAHATARATRDDHVRRVEQLEKDRDAARAELAEVADELSSCEICEAEFVAHAEGGTTPGRIVVCTSCWNKSIQTNQTVRAETWRASAARLRLARAVAGDWMDWLADECERAAAQAAEAVSAI